MAHGHDYDEYDEDDVILLDDLELTTTEARADLEVHLRKVNEEEFERLIDQDIFID